MENEKEILEHPEQFMEENRETLERALEANKKKAEKILNDEKKLDKLLGKIEKMCRTISKFPIPYFRNVIAYIPKMIWLIRDYKDHNYREIPYASIIAIIGWFIYFVSPIDLIPDTIPVAGLLDDLLALNVVLGIVSSDLDDYWEWHLYNHIEMGEEIEE